MPTVRCPKCSSAGLVMCIDCERDADACKCEASFDSSGYYCGSCDSIFIVDLEEEDLETQYGDAGFYDEGDEADMGLLDWLMGKEDEPLEEIKGLEPSEDVKPTQPPTTVTTPAGTVVKTGGGGGVTTPYKNNGKVKSYPVFEKCRHYNPKLEMADDVFIYPSSMANNRKENEMWPDFGLYADSGWKPGWRNEFVTFPDYGIPTYPDVAVDQIASAFERAIEGEVVEVGCIGGHGRTGTILACMKVYGSWYDEDEELISPEDACKWVWKNYCKEAIESPMQEWWVGYFSHVMFQTELVEKPKPKPKTAGQGYMGGCPQVDHFAMFLVGATECLIDGKECRFWEQDLKSPKWDAEKKVVKMHVPENDIKFFADLLAKEKSKAKHPATPPATAAKPPPPQQLKPLYPAEPAAKK